MGCLAHARDLDDAISDRDLHELVRRGDPRDRARVLAGRRPGVGAGRRAGFRGIGGGRPVDPVRDPVLALAFNGTALSNPNLDNNTDDVSFGDIPGSTNKRSFAAWVYYTDAAVSDRAIGGKWDTTITQGEFMVSRAGVSGRKLRMNTSTAGSDATGNGVVTDNDVFTESGWYHAAAVYDGAGASQLLRGKLYVDGVLISARTVSGTIAATMLDGTSHLRIGRWKDKATGSLPYRGLMRDVCYSGDTAWSDADVAALYASGTTPPGTDGRWALNGNLLDSIGAFHGTKSPVAPAGPGFVCRTQSYPWPGGNIVLIVGDSETANSCAWLPEFVSYLWHQFGIRVRIVGRYAAAGGPADFMAKYPSHSALSGKEIGVTAAQANSMRLHTPTDIATYLPDVIIEWGGKNDINTDAAAGAAGRVLGYEQSIVQESYATAGFDDADLFLFCSIGTRITGFDTAEIATYNAGLPARAVTLQGLGLNAVHSIAGERESGRGLAADGVHIGDIGNRKVGAQIAIDYEAAT